MSPPLRKHIAFLLQTQINVRAGKGAACTLKHRTTQGQSPFPAVRPEVADFGTFTPRLRDALYTVQ
jgi:hypothetical protein